MFHHLVKQVHSALTSVYCSEAHAIVSSRIICNIVVYSGADLNSLERQFIGSYNEGKLNMTKQFD